MNIGKIKSHIFSIVELDTNSLTSQTTIVAQVGSAGRYRGVVTESDNTTKEFSLEVLPSPAEPSVAIDLSAVWSGPPNFSVVVKGFIVLYVKDGPGGQTVKVFNDLGSLFDNSALTVDNSVVLKLFRPGIHQVSDTTGGGICTVKVEYPTPPTPPATNFVDIKVIQVSPGTTKMQPDAVTISPLQPLVFHTQDKTRLITELLALTDREGNILKTTLTEKGQKLKIKI